MMLLAAERWRSAKSGDDGRDLGAVFLKAHGIGDRDAADEIGGHGRGPPVCDHIHVNLCAVRPEGKARRSFAILHSEPHLRE
jgi:hypothetical protein